MTEPLPRTTAVIAEDETLLRDEIRETLHAIWPELEICGEADDGPAALQALDAHSPNILFLDISMPGASGLAVAQQASGKAHVVFITAFNEFAVAALEEGALDYVLKPISRERLGMTVLRLKARLDEVPADLSGLVGRLHQTLADRDRYLQWITVSHGPERQLITVDQISFFRADEKHTYVVTENAEHRIIKSLNSLVEELDPKVFWRINRGVIVNVNCILSVRRGFCGRIKVRLKHHPEMLSISAPYTYQFRQM